MSRPLAIVPDPIHEDGVAKLREQFRVEILAGHDDAAKREAFSRADAVIIRNLPIPSDLIDASPHLKVIAKHGTGVDNIDLSAATHRGIVVANVPGANADAVAEGAVVLMLAALRQVPAVHDFVARGDYAMRWKLHYGQLWERTLGLVGIGNVGARVARICAEGFKMRVVAYDPFLAADAIAARGAEKADDLQSLLKLADVVSLHIPLTDGTFHMISREQLRLMKPAAILVNTARGPLIDENALVEALTQGWISGAGLDVYEVEPPPPDAPILRAPNVVLSPHTAGSTDEAYRSLAVASAEIALDVIAGQRPSGLLNPEVWDRRRR